MNKTPSMFPAERITIPSKPCIVCGGVDEGNTCCPPESFDFELEEITAVIPVETMHALVFATKRPEL